MKANTTGHRPAATADRHAADRERGKDHLAPPFAPDEQHSYQRGLFVIHQQDLARRALHLGSPGAARAALRAVYAVDFADAAEAMQHLRVLRDPKAPPDLVMRALTCLVQMAPLGAAIAAAHE